MIDSHCHLDLNSFAQDVDDVLHRSRQAGVTRFLIPGTTESGWRRQAVLAEQHDDIDIALGLHPYFLASDDSALKAQLIALEHALASPPAALVAIGETGIDGVVNVPVACQMTALQRQLELAQATGLPVILHHRKSHHLLQQVLATSRFTQGGVIHAFSGSIDIARFYIDQGFLLGVGGTVTYPRGEKTRRSLASVSLEHVLLETDAPDMPMCGRQGKRNSPEYLGDVVPVLSRVFEVSDDAVIAQTTANYHRLFRRHFSA
ncbi:TatD family hydrolase [Alteromonas sp. CYL-A6]|uniref:TatD family hydrolase n=1 Tax=Alteromonas nitratireducens TaxID=3390813 RepID=UPI0034B2A458